MKLLTKFCRRLGFGKPKPDPDPVHEPVEVPPGWIDANPNVRTACRLYYQYRLAKSEAIRAEISRRIDMHTELTAGADRKRLNRYFRQMDELSTSLRGGTHALRGSGKSLRQDADKLWDDSAGLLDDGLDLLDDGLTWLGEKIGTRKRPGPGDRDT